MNILTGEWVLVSPRRLQRPWQGEVTRETPSPRPAYDPQCYLCPGNERSGGIRNPQYSGTFVFDNDFPALVPDTPAQAFRDGPLRAHSECGICRVLCFSPLHNRDVAQMDTGSIRLVIDAWAEQTAQLRTLPWVKAVTIFENRGAMMGASNPHPHCQIWAQSAQPTEVLKELRELSAYARRTARCLICEYCEYEVAARERVVYQNEHVAVVVPFWAVWPFELLVLPRAHTGALDAMQAEQRDGLAAALQALTSRYDRLFSVAFPYSMGFHQRPADAEDGTWHMHAHYYPPLLRSASVRKFMVGYEMLGEAQRDITGEEAAARLREV